MFIQVVFDQFVLAFIGSWNRLPCEYVGVHHAGAQHPEKSFPDKFGLPGHRSGCEGMVHQAPQIVCLVRFCHLLMVTVGKELHDPGKLYIPSAGAAGAMKQAFSLAAQRTWVPLVLPCCFSP